jgi:hypothetical protein
MGNTQNILANLIAVNFFKKNLIHLFDFHRESDKSYINIDRKRDIRLNLEEGIYEHIKM